MGTTVTLGNVIGITEDVFLEAVVPLQSHFYPNAVFFTVVGEVHHLVNRGFILVNMFYKGP